MSLKGGTVGSQARSQRHAWTCTEDGLEFRDLRELQLHMKRKTAWSNTSLVGCRVSVLLDNREWSEGIISQYHRSSGKHCVEFRASGERRWLHMLRTAFYIIERASHSLGTEETKEPEPSSGLAPVEPWTYAENLSLNFVRAQSIMYHCYGRRIQETGHKTLGHICVTEDDKRTAADAKGSLLYGELLPRGVNKALGPKHLNAARASTLFDLGMGTGKVALQAFLQFSNLKRVFGVELSAARFRIAEKALLNLLMMYPNKYVLQRHVTGKFLSVRALETSQVLEVACGNLMHIDDIQEADIVMLETEVSPEVFGQFSGMLNRAKEGSRLLTYLDLRKVWQLSGSFPFRQLEANRSFADRYPTSWSVQRGHHFFLWIKLLKPPLGSALSAAGGSQSAGASDGSEHTGKSKERGCFYPIIALFVSSPHGNIVEEVPTGGMGGPDTSTVGLGLSSSAASSADDSETMRETSAFSFVKPSVAGMTGIGAELTGARGQSEHRGRHGDGTDFSGEHSTPAASDVEVEPWGSSSAPTAIKRAAKPPLCILQ